MRRGLGNGCGYGRGGWNSSGSVSSSMKDGGNVDRLRAEAEFIRNDLDRINQQIADIEKTQTKE